MAMTSTVLTRVEDGVATLTLNRPKAMNAFDADDARAIVEAATAKSQASISPTPPPTAAPCTRAIEGLGKS